MDDTRREQLVTELEVIARTGGADAVQSLKTIAGALVEALGPSDHAKAVEDLMTKKHGDKLATAADVAPDDSVSGLAARGREVSQADLEAEQKERADARRARREEEGRLPGGDVVTLSPAENASPQGESEKRERQKERTPVAGAEGTAGEGDMVDVDDEIRRAGREPVTK